jgi:thiol:disulfide interchange protein
MYGSWEVIMEIQWTDDVDKALAAHKPVLLDFTAAPM